MLTFWVGWAVGLATGVWWFVALPWIAERLGFWRRDVSPRD